MVEKGKQGKEGNRQREGIIKWFIFTLIYAFIMGILYGTSNYYFENVPLIFGLYIDISWSIIILGLSGWAIISVYFKKKYDIRIF